MRDETRDQLLLVVARALMFGVVSIFSKDQLRALLKQAEEEAGVAGAAPAEPNQKLDPASLGDTCPYLKIARHFGLDYGRVLCIADMYTRASYPKWWREDFSGVPNEARAAIGAAARRFRELREGRARLS